MVEAKNIVIGIIVIALVLFAINNSPKIEFPKGKFPLFGVLPELDNRIEYVGSNAPESQYVRIKFGLWENDKFFADLGNEDIVPLSEFSHIRRYGSTSTPATTTAKKDFARLKTYIQADAVGGGIILLEDDINNPTITEWIHRSKDSTDIGFDNYEIIPDNLNKGIYDIFINGQYIERITIPNDHIFIKFTGTNVWVNYIKYVPLETFSIKNDEVWVKEVRGSSYSFANLNWEMIGYHSEIRPATIRDLTAQTEVPAPQIYINLINNLPVIVQPNTVHTFHYKTKWTQGLDSSCQGQLDKVEVKGSDGIWRCESFVKETPIIQQCQVKTDCPILPDCEAQKDLISCNNNLCDFSAFSPACRNQLITYQEIIKEIEGVKFVSVPSGVNSFYCFFDKTKSSCQVGEKTITATSPSYICQFQNEAVSTGTNPECWQSTLSFNNNNFVFNNGESKNDIGYGIKSEMSMSASYDDKKILRDSWGIAAKFTLPDNFLEIKAKDLGNKFVLKDSNEPVTFTITNKLFGINGGYTIQTQNLALEGGAIIRDEIKDIFLKLGDNDITYNFKTSQLGSIVDIIGAFGKVNTDKEYLLKSNENGMQRFLIISKEVKTEIPQEVEKVQPQIVEKTIIQEKEVEKEGFFASIPTGAKVIGAIIIIFLITRLL